MKKTNLFHHSRSADGSSMDVIVNLPGLSARSTRARRAQDWYVRLSMMAAACLLGMGVCSSARAFDDHARNEDSESTWGLGLGVGAMQKPYRDIDLDTIVLPIIVYDNSWLAVHGGSISVKLPSAGPVSFSLSVNVSRDGYEASDSSFLRGMDEREDLLWAGGNIRWQNSVADLSLSWLADVSGNSKGRKVSVGVERTFSAGRFDLSPRIGAVWLDEKYVNYYYGVREHEANKARRFYAPEATVNVEGGIRTSYRLSSGHSSLFLDVSAQSLGKEIKNSPLVDASIESTVLLGYLYMF